MRLHSKLSILALSALLSVSTSVPGFAAVVRTNAAANTQAADSNGNTAAAIIQAPSEEAVTAAPLPAVRNETSLGVFKTTGFTNPRGERSADGSVPQVGRTVAADWSVLPRGSKIRFAGSDTIYIVEDTGVRGQTIDVYYANTSEAWNHGVQYREVFLVLE